MLNPVVASAVAAQFGVTPDQVRRDHLISHLLATLSQSCGDRVVFIGGTALARTHLPEGRLSEDIDLMSVGPRRAFVDEVETVLARGASRAVGKLRWDPALTDVRATAHGVLRGPGQLVVRVQLLDEADYPGWPVEVRDLVQRYPDAPPACLRVPTLPAFAAAKTVAWADRGAARDLYDLWGLASAGLIDADAARLYARLGPTGQVPGGRLFSRVPSDAAWRAELAAQTRLAVGPDEAGAVVREAWRRAAAELRGQPPAG